MSVLMTHSYFLKLDPKQDQAKTPYPPLATLYAAAVLRKNEFDVKIFDAQFCGGGNEVETAFKDNSLEYFVIYDDDFNYLSKMCLTNMRHAAFEMIAIAKRKNCAVVVSSSDATDNYELYLEAGADFIITGEGEITLLELLKEFENREDFEKINGLIYKKGNAIVRTAPRAVLKDLDALPVPAWDLLDISPYKNTWMQHHGYFSLNFATTRGCPYKCNWCAKPVYGNRYNSHSPQYIVSLIEELQNKFHFSHIWFSDDIFGLKPGWLKEFADLIEEKKLRIEYKIQSRADLLIEENTAKDLARSGCKTVWMGAESGSQKILDAMDKGIRVEEIYEAVKLLKRNNIKPSLFLQFGYPGETMEDIRSTIQMANDLMPEDIGISVSYPLPGTKFYESVKSQLKQKANWSDSDDLDLMFHNTYSKEFYRQLHRYVHRSFRGKQSFRSFRNFVSFSNSSDRSLKRLFSFPFHYAAAIKEKIKLNQVEDAARSL